MYKIDESERGKLQNSLVEKIFQAFAEFDVCVLEAPAGFGKTFIALALAKSIALEQKEKTLISTAASNHTINFWKDSLKQESLKKSGTSFGFLIGKSNQTFKPCAFLDEWIAGNSEEESIYALCEKKKSAKECGYFSNAFGDSIDGETILTKSGEIASRQLHSIISNPFIDYREQDLAAIIRALKEKKLCPYYLLKQDFSNAEIKACDYQYLINPKYLEEDTTNYTLVIDEFDKFEERLREQFKISLSLNALNNALFDLSNGREIFSKTFKAIAYEQKADAIMELEKYSIVLKEFLENISKGLFLDQPIGVNFEKSFFKNAEFKEKHFQFNKFFEEHEETFAKIISNNALKNNPYRHILAFHYRLALSLEQKNAISFVEFVSKKRKNQNFDTIFARRPLIFTDFYNALAKRFKKILLMSATMPLPEMLEIGFSQKIKWFSVPKNLGLIGEKQGIILKSPFFDFSNRKRKENIAIKSQMIADLMNELSKIRKEIVVFFNAYASLEPCKRTLFPLLEENGFKIFMDEEKKDSKHDRDELWEKFKKTKAKKAMFSTMYTKYARGSNMLKDNGCRILLLVGIPYPQVFDFELSKFNELAEKNHWKIDAQTWYYVLGTRKTYTQAIGRLTRSKTDYGFFIILSNKSVDKILDTAHRDLLDIRKETVYTLEAADSAKLFFESAK